MNENTFTLYKLMILYMLGRLDFPLTTSQLSEFFIKRGYTGYFSFQQSLNDLAQKDFILGDVGTTYIDEIEKYLGIKK